MPADDDAAERQEEALAAGRLALEEGRPVIWIHGRAYAEPDAAEEPEPPAPDLAAERAHTWALWYGGDGTD